MELNICCTGLDAHIDAYNYSMISITQDEDNIRIDIDSDSGHGGSMIDVKYCPFCGKKFKIEKG